MENSMKKQQKIKKARPRGRPWPKGQSGNPAGRPPGSLNKISLAVLEGVRLAEEELAKPLMLDTSRHYEAWSDCFIQDGIRFRQDNHLRVNPGGPIPICPERLDIREIRREVVLKGRRYWSQRGWLFAMDTNLPVDL